MNVKMNLNRPAKLSKWSYCAKKFMEFCKRTDLHGFKYIAMEELSITERFVINLRIIILDSNFLFHRYSRYL